MSPRRLQPPAAARRALLAGVALAVACAAPASAQMKIMQQKAPHTQRPTNVGDGLAEDEVYLEADRISRDDTSRIVTAEGSVEARRQQRTLRANRVVYEQTPGIIRAYGDVQIIDADGTVEYAEEMVLDDKFYSGAALGFSARTPDGVKVASVTAARRNENIQELNRAIYTPCPICADNKPRRPTWSISAEKVVQNKRRRVILYRSARIQVLNTPVLYLPVFWHADPTAGRASGFLPPDLTITDRRGVSLEAPYLWVISPSADLTVAPQINSGVNPFLNTRLRKRFYSGDMDLRMGYTRERDFDGDGRRFGQSTNRSYILGRGGFQIDPRWRWGFTAERTSDDLLFDKYDIADVYRARGPYIADDRRLISQIYTVRQDSRSYLSAAAFTIQGLRPGDNDRTFPVVAPLVETRYEPRSSVWGGALRFQGSAVSLTRDQSVIASPTPLPGLDSRRVTAEMDWTRAFISPAGLRVDPFAHLRADAYSLRDLVVGTGTRTTSVTRGLATLGAEATYPVFRRFTRSTVVVEPVIQALYSPPAKQIVIGRNAAGGPVYLNEDSVAFELNETTLFRPNKFPGYDLYEDGTRLNVAGRATMLWDDGRRASALIGRSFRDEANDIFSVSSGLRRKASDWIVATDAQPLPGVSLFARARLDSDNWGVHRLETGANVGVKWGSGYVRYLTDDLDINGVKTENLDVGGEIYLTRNWGVSGYGSRDLARDAWTVRGLGVFYRDDCIRVDVLYRQEDTVIRSLGPHGSVSVRLTLATLGGTYGR